MRGHFFCARCPLVSMIRCFVLGLLLSLLLGTPAFAFTVVVTEPATPLVPTSVIELAQRLGYFAREGVDVRLLRVNGTPMAIVALSAGQGDLAEISLESLLKLNARGETRFRAISAPARSLSYVIVARDGIKSLQDLKGVSYGIGQTGTLDDTLTRTVLRRLGVDPEHLKLAAVGNPQLRLKALQAGKIDATTISYASWMTFPEKAGLHILLSKDAYFQAAPVVAKVNVVSTQTLRDRRSDVGKVVAALLKLARTFAADPQRWAVGMQGARPDVPEGELRSLAESYAADWCVDGCFGPDELASSAQIFQAAPGFPAGKSPRLADWTDRSILSDVLATIGRARRSSGQ